MRFLGEKYAKNAFAAGAPRWGSLQHSPEPLHCKICLGKYNQKNLVKFIWLLPQMCLV